MEKYLIENIDTNLWVSEKSEHDTINALEALSWDSDLVDKAWLEKEQEKGRRIDYKVTEHQFIECSK